MNTPSSHSPPNKYANCAKTLPIQVAAISVTPINTSSPLVRVIIPSGSQVHNMGLDGGTPENPIFIGNPGGCWKKVGKEKNVEKGGKSAKCFAKSLPSLKGVGKVFYP